MNDKQFTKVAFIALGIFFLWWLIQRKNAAVNGEPESEPNAVDPNTLAYAADPGAYQPASLGNLNITIANQGLGYLDDKYIPLFGFVGMAQGVGYG